MIEVSISKTDAHNLFKTWRLVQTKLETDYLIIGAGAMGMAFLDELIHSSTHRAIIVDTRSKPGGHWNNAYKFVRLHQPALFYGVNSTKLGSGYPEDLSTGICPTKSILVMPEITLICVVLEHKKVH